MSGARGAAGMTGGSEREYEFLLTDQDYRRIQRLVAEHSGIVLNDSKRDMVYSRLVRRLRDLKLASFASYLKRLSSDVDEELGPFINALTTNLTAFFREPHHFDFVTREVLPELVRRQPRLRIWSAGCSTGEEPYSLAIAIREGLPSDNFDVRILATDLDTNVLATAQAGIYREERVTNVGSARLKRWFLRGRNGNQGMVRVSQELRDMITFRQLNLLNEWPMSGPLDAIFCRNVVIYFDKETQRGLFDRYADLLAEGGYLFIGHSESLFKVTDRFELIGNTIYRKRW